MKRIVKIGIAVLTAIVVLGLVTGCPESSKSSGGSDATLTSVKFGNETATLGTPAATWSSATAGTVTILNSRVTIVATPKDTKATLEFAIAPDGELDEEDFWGETTLDFKIGDQLAIKVTSGDQKTVLYYRIGVNLAGVGLQSVTVGGVSAVTLGTAGSAYNTAIAGSILFTTKEDEQPAGGMEIVATLTAAAAAQNATITYAKAAGNTEPTFGETATIKFADGDYLYIKVTGTSGSAVYKIQVNFKQEGTIRYGSPVIKDGELDPIWDNPTLQVYPIAKVYAADSGSYLDPNNEFPETVANAKALWDEEGLSIYVWVKDGDVSLVDNEHESDSFELFVNEDLSAVPSPYVEAAAKAAYTNGGSQYRVGANGQRSGEGQSPAAMNALNKTSAWKTADGYIIVMKAPWRLRNKFFTPTSYRNDWEFGFELQVNIAGVSSNRYGVLVWNNVSHTNYQNAGDYGVAKLIGGPDSPNYPAVDPIITSQPKGDVVSVGDSVTLTVAASDPVDGGAITYEWFKADTAAGEGTSVSTGGTYTFSFAATAYYYAIVTNTVGSNKSTTKSAVAGIIDAASIVLPTDWVEKIVNPGNGSVPVYGFKLPAGDTFGDYDTIKFDLRMDAASDMATGRIRSWGPYSSTAWADVSVTPGNSDMKNASPGGLLLSTGSDATVPTVWTPTTITFNNRDTLTDKDTIKGTTGVILLAFGPIGNNDSNSNNGTNTTTRTRTWYIKNITLESSTDTTKKVTVLHPDHPLLWGGNGASAYVTQDGNHKVTRTLYDWVDEVTTQGNASVSLYGFKLPAGKTFGDYDSVNFSLKMATDSEMPSGRTRAWGTYAASAYVPSKLFDQGAQIQNATPGGLLLSTGSDATVPTVWTSTTITFNNRDTLTEKEAIKAANGVIILGFGPIGNNDSNTPLKSRHYYIMGVTLVDSTGANLPIKALSPDSPLLWAGEGKGAYVTQDGSHKVTRVLSGINFADF